MTGSALEHPQGHGGDTVPLFLDLDHPLCADPVVSGAKAARLSRARAEGLPALPGVVVTAAVSRPHLDRGIDALARRGSGGARLEISHSEMPAALTADLASRAARLGDTLVVRSSSELEAGGEWSGAFTSYLDIRPQEVARAVRGCWASTFTVSTLARHEASGIPPGSVSMAVLIQRALDPEFGGTARLESGDVIVTAVCGSPAPLVQGWEPGVQSRVSADGHAKGDGGMNLMGPDMLEAVADVLRAAHTAVGANSCEWAVVGGEVTLLQLMTTRSQPLFSRPPGGTAFAGATAAGLARLARRYPGPLGESLVLPWAVGNPGAFLDEAAPADLDPLEALAFATEQAATLTAEVWALPKPAAARAASAALRAARGGEPGAVWDTLAALKAPDPDRARGVLASLATVRNALVSAGAITWPSTGWNLEPAEIRGVLGGSAHVSKRRRIGFDRWEPFDASVAMARGRSAEGTGAAPGIACGRLRWIPGPDAMSRFRPRDVIVSPHPTPNLAALLWDAAAIVTTGGGPGAHLFESARALAIPAVCGIHLDEALGETLASADGRFALAVDGTSGAVFATEW